MRHLTLSTVLAAAILAGCTADHTPTSDFSEFTDGMPSRCEGLGEFPTHTPYDNDPAMRAVYMHFYWYGYAEGAQGMGSISCGSKHPWTDVQQAGHLAGQMSGRLHWMASMGKPADPETADQH